MEIHTNAKGVVGMTNVKMLLIKKSVGWCSKDGNNSLLPLTSFIPVLFSCIFFFCSLFFMLLNKQLSIYTGLDKISVAVYYHWENPVC